MRSCRCATLAKLGMAGQVAGVPEKAAPFFRDVADHLARVAGRSTPSTPLLSTAFEAHLAQISVQQNNDMRKISAWVGLVAPPTLIAGIYGMNFRHMPELGVGYPVRAAADGGHLRHVWHVLVAVRLSSASVGATGWVAGAQVGAITPVASSPISSSPRATR